jgi:hypothetical protein
VAIHELRLLSLNGNLGLGYAGVSLQKGIAASPHMLGVDNGSTDPGPYYLGSGEQSSKRAVVKRDLSGAMLAALQAGIPFVIGSAGTGGGEPHIAAVRTIIRELAQQYTRHFRLAVIHAEIAKDKVRTALANGQIRPLAGVPPLTPEAIDASTRIVGQMGIEPFMKAFDTKADVILAGRACDAAIFAAMPAMYGFDLGLAMHLANIMECGASCAIPQASNDCLLGILRSDHFLVRVPNPERRCTPKSVAAHSLYEKSDPFIIEEPGGSIDMTDSVFEQVDQQTVRVSGSRWQPSPTYTIKLEGAKLCGYRSVAIAGARDPGVVRNLDVIEAETRHVVAKAMEGVLAADQYQMRMIMYGRDGVMGKLEPSHHAGHEVGVVVEVIAPTQEMADTVIALARSLALHRSFPGRKTTAGNLAMPFSPAEFRGGAVYEFSVYHVMEVADPLSLFPIEIESV